MASMASYFVKNSKNLIPNQKNIIKGDKYRFSILSPRLIRIEYNKDNIFEDRATSLIVKRNFGDVQFTTSQTDLSLTITTEYFTLTYIKSSPITSKNLKVVVNGTDREWYPGHKEIRNLGSINYSLEYLDDNLKLDKGLYSFDGFSLLDDSYNFVIENDMFLPRDNTTIDLYLFVYNNDLGLCLQDYFNLTGYPPMIPRYALGSWWYKNDPYNMYDIDNLIKKFNDNHIPISVFLLGNKWHNTTENFSYDKSLFDQNILYKYYQSKKQKFGLTINPELPIYQNDPLYNSLQGVLNNYHNYLSFIPLNNNTISAYLNTVVNNLKSTGINLFNIDYYNESDKQGLFLLNHYHYIIANLNELGIILSRNPGVAPHRYPIIYSGRTKVSWDTLKVLPTYNNSAANLGISWHAHAIGGYYGGIEDDELYLRYIQFGVFNPIFILAGDTGKYYKREPWKWNQINLSVIREYMQLRNKLIPYIYNEGYTYHQYGVPIVQPLYYKYPKIYDEPNYVNQYFFGSKIMISPIVKRKNHEMNRVVQRIFIPNGIWYDYTSGKKFAGNKYYVNFYKDEDYPIFVKEGSIIPMSLDDTTDVPKNMEIQIFPAENGLYGSYELYEDDGISLNRNQNYLITKMNLDKVDNGYKFTMKRKDGNFNISNRNYLLRFRNMKSPSKVIVKYQNKEEIYQYEIEKNDLIIKLNDMNPYEPLEVNIIGNNIEIETISVINEEIEGILDDLEINTIIKEEIDSIIFSDLPIKKKRIGLRKLRKSGLEPKYINMFIGLLEFIENK
ncbi:MAG: TIM-barrel domain-containing protein [Bacilli bacterium]